MNDADVWELLRQDTAAKFEEAERVKRASRRCGHRRACLYGEDIVAHRSVWWCHQCGALAMMLNRRGAQGRPKRGDWQLPLCRKEGVS